MGIKSFALATASAIGTTIGNSWSYTKRAMPGVGPLGYYKLYPGKPGMGGLIGAGLQESPEYRTDLVQVPLSDPTEQSQFNQQIPNKMKKARQQTQAIGADLFFQHKYFGANRQATYKTNNANANLPLNILENNVTSFNENDKNILMQNIRKFYDPDSTDKNVYNQNSDRRLLVKAAHDVIYDIMRTRQMIRTKDQVSGMFPGANDKMEIKNALNDNPQILSALIALKFVGSNKAQSRSEIVTEIRENKTARATAYRAKVNAFIETKNIQAVTEMHTDAFLQSIRNYEYGKRPGTNSGGLATLDAKF